MSSQMTDDVDIPDFQILVVKMSNGKSKMVASRAFLTLFEEQENCDVFFQLGSDTIGAHKAFLQARSQVLYEWASAAQEKPIPIDGLSFEAFKAVLR